MNSNRISGEAGDARAAPGGATAGAKTPLRVLFVEDSGEDEVMMLRALRRDGYAPAHERVQSIEGMRSALTRNPWDVILCDNAIPGFDATSMLQFLRDADLQVPMIIVAGTIDEEAAVAAVKLGAADYILKDRMARLGAAIGSAIDQRRLRRERKQAEDERREFERRFREMLENVELMALTLDRKGSVTFCNNCLLRTTGWRRQEVVGSNWFRRFAPLEGSGSGGVSAADLDGGGFPPHHRSAIRTKRGELREILWSNTILRDPSGEVAGLASIGEDVTDRGRPLDGDRGGDLFRTIFDHAGIGIALVSPGDGRILRCNGSLAEMLGYGVAELCGMTVAAISHPDDLKIEAGLLQRVIDGSAGRFQMEKRYVRRDGGVAWGLHMGTVVRDAEAKPLFVIATVEAISESRPARPDVPEAEQQLHALIDRLNAVREEEARRIARQLHDNLGQQLTSLNIEFSDLEMKLSYTVPKQQRQIARMHSAVGQTLEEVRRITGELRLGQLDVLGLNGAIDWQLGEFTRRTGIRCRVEHLDDATGLSDAQNTALFRILQEALSNVARHAAATEVRVGLEADHGHVTLRVCDNGRGITAAERESKGSLGLLGMRERARLVGGEVAIGGGRGAGTEVAVRI